MSTKSDIIAVLKKQEELESALHETCKQRDLLSAQIKSCRNDLDLIFANIQSTDYDKYKEMLIDGTNEFVARFEMEGEIVEVIRDMRYEEPIDRIKIARWSTIEGISNHEGLDYCRKINIIQDE